MIRYLIFVGITIMSTLSAAPRITVIGAGLAGLTTAYRLQQMGYEVDIYEARERPGGRVVTATFAEVREELGATNILDGAPATNMLRLIHELGLMTYTYSVIDDPVILYDGKLLSDRALYVNGPVPTGELFESIVSQPANSLSDRLDALFPTDPILRYRAENFVQGWEGSPSCELAPEFFETYWKECYKLNWDDAHSGGGGRNRRREWLRVMGGNDLLVNALEAQLKRCIHYNSPLRQVSRSTDGTIHLHFDHAGTVATDYLILAIPSSTLRDVSIQSGLVPADQRHAIATHHYATTAKVLVPVKSETSLKSISSKDIFVWIDPDLRVMTVYCRALTGAFNDISDIVQQGLDLAAKANPNIRLDESLPPQGVSWTNEEFSKGSYSNYGVGQYQLLNETIEQLGETVRKVYRSIDDQIFFAGEHTALDVPATMEGAVQSGERAARMVLRAHQGSTLQQ